MSALDQVFAEEYERLERIRNAIEKELLSIPKGCLSRKKIDDRVYFYLQKREEGKVVSVFIPFPDVELWEKRIARRRQLEASLRECKKNMRKLERVL